MQQPARQANKEAVPGYAVREATPVMYMADICPEQYELIHRWENHQVTFRDKPHYVVTANYTNGDGPVCTLILGPCPEHLFAASEKCQETVNAITTRREV